MRVELMTMTRQSLSFSEFSQTSCRVPCPLPLLNPVPVLCQKISKKNFRPTVLLQFLPHKSSKKAFSVFERRLLPVEVERERTPFVSITNPNRIDNPRLGTRFESFCGHFYANQRVFLSRF